MDYISPKGDKLTCFEDWENLFLLNPRKKKDWQESRSAYSLANFMINENGKDYIIKLISKLIGESVTLYKATPELETRFDKFKNGREHDLGIWGQTDSGKSVFIGVESKVDEAFNCKVSDAYLIAKSKELNAKRTDAPNRIEGLLKRSFPVIQKKHWDLMYQLFYTLFGTLDSKNNGEKADIPIMLFLVFKTTSYNEDYGLRNYKDYIAFINQLDSSKIKSIRLNVVAHTIQIENKYMYSIYCQL